MLELKLLGVPKLIYQGQSINLPPPKTFAMLCYLAIKGTDCTREELSELLWGTQKTGSLRVALTELRNLPEAERWLKTQGQLVSASLPSDVVELETSLKKGNVNKALNIWGNAEEKIFLKGLKLRGGEAFINWLESERFNLNQLYFEVFQERIAELEAESNYSKALELARQLVSQDKLNEDMHRIIMRLEHKHGNIEAALMQFEHCRQILQEELGIEPLAETLDLLRDIERGNSTSKGKRAILAKIVEDIPARPEKLIGRDELLKEVEGELKVKERILLHGFGGMGKTALAATIAARHLKDANTKVLWLQAGDDDPYTLFDAISLVFDAKQRVSQAKNIDKGKLIHDLFTKYSISLLILDDVWNAYALSKIIEIIPENLPLLVTARQRYPKLRRKDVGNLPRKQALQLFSYYAKKDFARNKTADELCNVLGDHAFALRIAGVTLAVENTTTKELLKNIKDAPHKMKMPAEFAEEGRESVANLLTATLQVLSDEAFEALLAFGVLFTASCTSELLALCIRRNEEEVEESLIELQKRGLAERLTEPSNDVVTYRLHDLVFSFTKANCLHLRGSTAVRACKNFLENHQHNFAIIDAEIGNILGAMQATAQNNKALFIEMMCLLVMEDSYYKARGHSSHSLKLLKKAISESRQLNKLEIAHYLATKLGDAYRELEGNFDLAFEYYQEALQLAQQLGDHHREAILLSMIGITRFHQKHDDSSLYLKDAYQLAKSYNDNLAVCHVLQHQSHLAYFTSNWQEMLELTSKAVRIAKELSKDPSIKSAEITKRLFFALLNLGEAEYKTGNFDKALTTRHQALELSKEQDNHLWMAYAWHEIGEMYHGVDKRTLAQENYDKALKLYKQNHALVDIEKLTEFMYSEGYGVGSNSS